MLTVQLLYKDWSILFMAEIISFKLVILMVQWNISHIGAFTCQCLSLTFIKIQQMRTLFRLLTKDKLNSLRVTEHEHSLFEHSLNTRCHGIGSHLIYRAKYSPKITTGFKETSGIIRRRNTV